MGWKGTLRSMEASARKSERNSQRRQRELQKRQAQYAKMEALEQAAYEVEVYDNQIEVLLSVHKECGEEIDWSSFTNRAEPVQPQLASSSEAQARACVHPQFLRQTAQAREQAASKAQGSSRVGQARR
jgi:uncharacterized membrane protein YkoI